MCFPILESAKDFPILKELQIKKSLIKSRNKNENLQNSSLENKDLEDRIVVCNFINCIYIVILFHYEVLVFLYMCGKVHKAQNL